jgi:hypothetical protein
MTPNLFYERIVAPTQLLLFSLPDVKITPTKEAAVMLMAIAGQESNWMDRRQIGGPARGYWQFEEHGGVAELFQKTPTQLHALSMTIDVPYNQSVVFEAMAWNDTLSCAMARLLLWQDPHPLPAIGDKDASWQYYLRNWRPGAPHPEHWTGNYDKGLAAIGGN